MNLPPELQAQLDRFRHESAIDLAYYQQVASALSSQQFLADLNAVTPRPQYRSKAVRVTMRLLSNLYDHLARRRAGRATPVGDSKQGERVVITVTATPVTTEEKQPPPIIIIDVD